MSKSPECFGRNYASLRTVDVNRVLRFHGVRQKERNCVCAYQTSKFCNALLRSERGVWADDARQCLN